MKTELAENVQLKKVLLSSVEEELRKATRENDALTPLSAIRSKICGNCHKSGHRRSRCTSPPCPSHDACGLRDKHPELREKISELQKEIKRLQQEHSDQCRIKAGSVLRVPHEGVNFVFCSHASQTESPQFNQVQ